jgi:hypothetical protein
VGRTDVDRRRRGLGARPAAPHQSVERLDPFHYQLLEGGVIELTFECIPRRDTFKHGYVGLFWASYIHQPESLDIHFLGRPSDGNASPDWIRGVTPKHGVLATHLALDDHRPFAHAEAFPLTLVFNVSKHCYAEPWYFGVCRDMAFTQIFRAPDRVCLSQSPSGGGAGNPAWDFQWFIPEYKVGQRYQLVMRALYLPLQGDSGSGDAREQVRRAVKRAGRFD